PLSRQRCLARVGTARHGELRPCARKCVRCAMQNPPGYRSSPNRRPGIPRDSRRLTPHVSRHLRPPLLQRTERPALTDRVPRWAVSVLRLSAATALAMVVLLVLTSLGLAHGIEDEMTSAGFDADRAQLIASALLALAGGVVAGIVLRWRLPVW